jgi:hypothetical protein
MAYRRDSDETLRLDLARLRRLSLGPDSPQIISWSVDDRIVHLVVVRLHDDCVWINDQRVPLRWTATNFDGQRAWFGCGCGRRARVLWWTGSEFTCRTCADVVYTVTREASGGVDRALRRVATLRRRLGAPPQPWWEPAWVKPKQMWFETFEHLAQALREAQAEAHWRLHVSIDQLEADLPRHGYDRRAPQDD